MEYIYYATPELKDGKIILGETASLYPKELESPLFSKEELNNLDVFSNLNELKKYAVYVNKSDDNEVTYILKIPRLSYHNPNMYFDEFRKVILS